MGEVAFKVQGADVTERYIAFNITVDSTEGAGDINVFDVAEVQAPLSSISFSFVAIVGEQSIGAVGNCQCIKFIDCQFIVLYSYDIAAELEFD